MINNLNENKQFIQEINNKLLIIKIIEKYKKLVFSELFLNEDNNIFDNTMMFFNKLFLSIENNKKYYFEYLFSLVNDLSILTLVVIDIIKIFENNDKINFSSEIKRILTKYKNVKSTLFTIHKKNSNSLEKRMDSNILFSNTVLNSEKQFLMNGLILSKLNKTISQNKWALIIFIIVNAILIIINIILST